MDHLLMAANAAGQNNSNPSGGLEQPTVLAADESRNFKCGICNKLYLRADHLSRHINTHEAVPPYACSICQKRFARIDLLTRHSFIHQRGQNVSPKSSNRGATRASKACKRCAAAKLKCEGGTPCSKCRSKGLDCVYAPSLRKGSSRSRISPQSSSTEVPEEFDQQSSRNILEAAVPIDFPHMNYLGARSIEQQNFNDSGVEPTGNALLPGVGINNRPGTFTPRDFLDFGGDLNFELDDMDFQFLSSLQHEANRENGMPNTRGETTRQVSPCENVPISGGSEAFQKSLWCWTPRRQDQAYAEQDNLTISTRPVNLDIQSFNNAAPFSTTIDQPTRDRVLGMVLSAFEVTTPSPSSVFSFPSSGVLTDLFQFFLVQQMSSVDSWVHPEISQPAETRIEVMAAFVASGASQSALPTIQKFGYALQEALRLRMPALLEKNNTLTRDLGMSQAWALIIQTGLWSGQKRKIEIAESFLQPPLTMLRRAGRLRRGPYLTSLPEPADLGNGLQEKWHMWIQNESFKRLAVHFFLHDAQASMALHINPLISEAELLLPLPVSSKIWAARTAMDWKAACLDANITAETAIASVAECIHDISNLSSVKHLIDFPLSVLAVLHGYWRLIWSYQQLVSLRGCSSTEGIGTSRLMITSRQYELTQMLKIFRYCVMSNLEGASRNVIILTLELLSMYLHVSMEELQLFAGKEGEEEARRSFPRLKEWVQESNSKQGVWYAGQVLRAAKEFAPGALRDFYAIAVYHASLTLWSYGIVSRALGAPQIQATHGYDSSNSFSLDGSEDERVERFLLLGQGSPFISGVHNSNQEHLGGTISPDSASLSNPTAVMGVCLQILESNYEYISEGFGNPPLVDNLGNLMKDLSKSTNVLY